MFISSYYPDFVTRKYQDNPNFDEKELNNADWYLFAEITPQIIKAVREGKSRIVLYRKDFPSKQVESEVCRMLNYRGYHTIGDLISIVVTWY